MASTLDREADRPWILDSTEIPSGMVMLNGIGITRGERMELRIKQLASAILIMSGDDPANFKIRAWEAACDALKTFRQEVLDEAASLCEGMVLDRERPYDNGCHSCAAGIRSLKDK
jgi:hypothetical protein